MKLCVLFLFVIMSVKCAEDIYTLLLNQKLLLHYIAPQDGHRLLLVNTRFYKTLTAIRKEAVSEYSLDILSKKSLLMIGKYTSVKVEAALIDGIGQHALCYARDVQCFTAYIVIYSLSKNMVIQKKQLAPEFANPTVCVTNAQHTSFCIAYPDYFIIADWFHRIKKREDVHSYVPQQYEKSPHGILCTKSVRAAWPVIGTRVCEAKRESYVMHDDGFIYDLNGNVRECWREVLSTKGQNTKYSLVMW